MSRSAVRVLPEADVAAVFPDRPAERAEVLGQRLGRPGEVPVRPIVNGEHLAAEPPQEAGAEHRADAVDAVDRDPELLFPDRFDVDHLEDPFLMQRKRVRQDPDSAVVAFGAVRQISLIVQIEQSGRLAGREKRSGARPMNLSAFHCGGLWLAVMAMPPPPRSI